MKALAEGKKHPLLSPEPTTKTLIGPNTFIQQRPEDSFIRKLPGRILYGCDVALTPVTRFIKKNRALIAGLILGTLITAADIRLSSPQKRSPHEDTITPQLDYKGELKSKSYKVSSGNTLWYLIALFLREECNKQVNNEELDRIKDRLFAQYGNRIHQLHLDEIITLIELPSESKEDIDIKIPEFEKR